MDNRIEEVARWCGFIDVHYNALGNAGEKWQGRLSGSEFISLEPTLDWLFKYPVAKLAELGYMTRLQYSPLRDNETGELISDWTGYAEIYYLKYDRPLFQKRNLFAINKQLKEALLEAIIQVIGEE